MELLAEGRDADVYALDEGRVLRRRRRGQPPSWVTDLASHVREHGVPAPAVLDVDGTDVVYERVHGPSLMEDLAARPWKVAAHARTLAHLHDLVHAIAAPAYLPRVGDADQLLHLDLHPANVLLGPEGPVVIDWTNAASGEGSQDVALTWVLLRTAPLPPSNGLRWPLVAARRLFLASFLRASGRAAARRHLGFAIAYRMREPTLVADETVSLERFRAQIEQARA